ncbi:Pentapeptide repeat-containing protein [Streptomyces sp. 2112.3]|nr:Pentapeptide repeat-containing protein [Streptomyces sp. 2112.3]
MTPPVEWDQLPDGPGLIARATEPATSAAEPTAAEAPRQQMNWSAISSVVTTFTALAALVFTAQSLSATEQGQFTDRYTKAMDQIGTLGEEHLQTRLGAVYALERLARDSPPDQPTIVQVLSAFVRANLPQATPQAILLPSGALPPPPPPRPRPRPCPSVAVAPHSLTLDVQAALTVLGRRDRSKDNGAVTDLRNTCLASTDLSHLNLTAANLNGANLVGANLMGANLDRAQHDQHTITKGAVPTGATGVWW